MSKSMDSYTFEMYESVLFFLPFLFLSSLLCLFISFFHFCCIFLPFLFCLNSIFYLLCYSPLFLSFIVYYFSFKFGLFRFLFVPMCLAFFPCFSLSFIIASIFFLFLLSPFFLHILSFFTSLHSLFFILSFNSSFPFLSFFLSVLLSYFLFQVGSSLPCICLSLFYLTYLPINFFPTLTRSVRRYRETQGRSKEGFESKKETRELHATENDLTRGWERDQAMMRVLEWMVMLQKMKEAHEEEKKSHRNSCQRWVVDQGW